MVAALGRGKTVSDAAMSDLQIPATGCGGGRGDPPGRSSHSDSAGADRDAAAPAFFDAAAGTVVIPVAGRALSLHPARAGVPASLVVALTRDEECALHVGLRAAWGFS